MHFIANFVYVNVLHINLICFVKSQSVFLSFSNLVILYDNLGNWANIGSQNGTFTFQWSGL